jgi:hypothetical protein
VIAIGGDDVVFGAQAELHAGTNSLLAVVQVKESANQFAFVQRIRRDFNAAHAVHQRVRFEHFVATRFGFAHFRTVTVVNQKWLLFDE